MASLSASLGSTETRRVLAASVSGTVFEWYDFFIFGVLAAIIAEQFFADSGEIAGLIFALGTFAAGFVARPFGALWFGSRGDSRGRKRTFQTTLLIMGLSTITVGLLPTHAMIGTLAPILLVLLRLLQGFAIGGEYGGAVVYVAEHAPTDRRGLHTSMVQAAASLGLILALGVVLAVRLALGEELFRAWGWRIPFLLSALILLVAMYIRGQLEESPAFQQMKREGRVARAPLKEAFLEWPNLKLGLIALFGIMAANGVIWYTAYFYVQFFLEKIMRVDGRTVNILLVTVATLAAPAYMLFGWLSDRVGRKPVMLAGVIGSILVLHPAFQALAEASNPALVAAREQVEVVIEAPPEDCVSRMDPLNRTAPRTACELARRTLTARGLPFAERAANDGATRVLVDETPITLAPSGEFARSDEEALGRLVGAQFTALGHPLESAAEPDLLRLAVIMTGLALLAAMIYGPLAAALAELFPARIRYSGLSLPYHLGSGWLGGFQPAASFTIVASTGDPLAGLWYPLVVASIGAVVLLLWVPETRGRWM